MIKMLINKEEVLSDREFTINEEMLATSSTILNNCYPKSWENDKDYTSRFYYPKDYSLCEILDDDKLVFAGVVKNSANISINPRYPHFGSFEILGFKTFLSECDTLDFVISDKTITEAIEMVVDAIKEYGFIVGNINIHGADNKIGAYSTLNKAPYEVFQYLADITQSKWYTRLLDDEKVAIDFYDPTLMPRAENIEYTTEYFEDKKIIDMSLSYGSYDYRNKQIMISNEVYGNIDYTNNIVADGYSKIFTTEANIGEIKSITVAGASKSFATKEDKDLGINADFYYTVGKNQLETDENITNGTSIVVVYTPIIKGRQVVTNEDEIQRIATQLGKKGVITRYENRNDVLDSDELNKIGQSYIRYKGTPEVVITIQTEDVDILNIGQIVYFNAPINDLKQDYMVKKKQTKIIPIANKIFYTYEINSNFNSESDINYFDNQRSKASGNIEKGDFIDRNIDINTESNIIFSGLTISEVSINGNNVLDSILDSPFVE